MSTTDEAPPASDRLNARGETFPARVRELLHAHSMRRKAIRTAAGRSTVETFPVDIESIVRSHARATGRSVHVIGMTVHRDGIMALVRATPEDAATPGEPWALLVERNAEGWAVTEQLTPEDYERSICTVDGGIEV
jgi:hypothetical protein